MKTNHKMETYRDAMFSGDGMTMFMAEARKALDYDRDRFIRNARAMSYTLLEMAKRAEDEPMWVPSGAGGGWMARDGGELDANLAEIKRAVGTLHDAAEACAAADEFLAEKDKEEAK